VRKWFSHKIVLSAISMHKQGDTTNTMNIDLDINWPIQQHTLIAISC